MTGGPHRTERSRRRRAYRTGRLAEAAAAVLLTIKGYRVLERGFRSPAGEIDLVARRGRTLAFVEVKSRATLADAAWSVTPRQQARIARAAEHWQALNPKFADCGISLDVILIKPWSPPRHLQGAFRV